MRKGACKPEAEPDADTDADADTDSDSDADPETSGHQAVGAELASARRRAAPRRLLPESETETDSETAGC